MTTSQPVGRRRLSPDDRRTELLDAAAHIAIEHNDIAAATLERVAEASSCSRNLAYRYFPNHAALVEALAGRERAAIADRLTQIPFDAPFDQWFASVVEAVLDLAEERGRLVLMLFEQAMIPRSGRRREVMVGIVIAKLQQSGLTPGRARVVAPVLASSLLGAAGVVVSEPRDRKTVTAELVKVVNALLA